MEFNINALKPLDYIIIAVAILVIVIGLLVILGKNKFAKSPVEATKKIAFEVMLRSVGITDNASPIRIGDDAFITIRNVPYTKLQIIDTKISQKKAILPVNNAKNPFVVIDDYSQPFQYDIIVALIDDAKITADGPVVGGNKIKIGVPIVLEGFNYRIGGTVSNVQVLEDEKIAQIEKYVATHKAKNAQNQEKSENPEQQAQNKQ